VSQRHPEAVSPSSNSGARLGSVRLRTALVVMLVSLVLVTLTDVLHLRHQMQQAEQLLPSASIGAPNAGIQTAVNSPRPGFDPGATALPVSKERLALVQADWKARLPGILIRDLSLVVLLGIALTLVLDRMLLRPLRRLAQHADDFDPTLPPPEPEARQPNELARISHSISRAQQSLWVQLQEERRHAEQMRLELERQQQSLRLAEQSLAQKSQELGRLSRIDALTGLANRREFDEALRREFKRAQRQRGQLALAVLDLDHFKNYNERYGVAAGDAALLRFAQLLTERFKRDTDLVARLGGEEFVALLPGFGLSSTQSLLEQVREDLRDLQLLHEGGVNGQVLTVSIGLAAFSPSHPYLSPQALMQAADEALYIAKHTGRDRLSLAASSGVAERA
jgi:diguanylate cyclase (GGDEF)-like protein